MTQPNWNEIGPELLEALYAADSFIAQTKPEGHRRIRDRLSIAIAKATGEEQ